MRSLVIFLVLLVVGMPISHAKVVEVPGVGSGEEVPEPLRDGDGVKKFVYAGSKIVASIEDSGVEYYHQGRMSNRLTTDSSGSLDKEFKSLPFGQKIENSGVDYPFTGKEEDESSLYYFGARYYDDNLGRFVSVDPVPGEHSYAYVLNNPMNFVDPTGMAGAPADATMVGEPDLSGKRNVFPSVSYLYKESQTFRSQEDGAAHFWMGLPSAVLSDVIYNLPGSEANRLDSPEISQDAASLVELGALAISGVSSLAGPGVIAGRGSPAQAKPSYGKVPVESVRHNNQEAFKTVLRGERPVALLEQGGMNPPHLRVSDMQLKMAKERGAIGGYIKTGWHAVDEQGVRSGIPNPSTIVYGKGKHAEGLARELAELYSGDIPVKPGHLPGLNHKRVGQILHYTDDEIASFLSSHKVAGQ